MAERPPIVELVEDQLIEAEPSEEDVLMAFESQIDDIVDHFWRQTHSLAVEHAVLAGRQNHQANLQQAALLAVNANAETRAQELAARQVLTTAQIEQALADTRAGMERQILQVVSDQAQLNDSTSALQEQLSHIIEVAQREAVSTLNTLSDQTSRLIEFEHHVYVEERVQYIHDQLSTRIDIVGESAMASAHLARDVREHWNEVEVKIREELEKVKNDLIDECVAATERRLSSNRSTRHTRLLIDRSISGVEERLEEKLRVAFQAAHAGHPAREQALVDMATAASSEADDVLEERLRKEMREAQAMLAGEIQVQSRAIGAVDARVSQLCEGLSRRISALERGRCEPQSADVSKLHQSQSVLDDRMGQLEARMKDMEQRLHADLKQLLRKKRVMHPAFCSKKVKQAAARSQREVRGRAEVAARYYDMLWKSIPQQEREETKNEE